MSITLNDVAVEVTLEVEIYCKCGNELSTYKDPRRRENKITVMPCEDCLQELREQLVDPCR